MPRKSISTYPPNWAEIAQHVKDAAEGRCIRCAQPHDTAAGYMLTVHHLDLDKGNCAWWNIPPLCQRCHLTIQAKVIMNQGWMFDHSDWFKVYAAAYYGVQAGLLPATRNYFDSLILVRREFVETRMDYLLSLGKPQEIGA
jgi:hypothetical protein